MMASSVIVKEFEEELLARVKDFEQDMRTIASYMEVCRGLFLPPEPEVKQEEQHTNSSPDMSPIQTKTRRHEVVVPPSPPTPPSPKKEAPAKIKVVAPPPPAPAPQQKKNPPSPARPADRGRTQQGPAQPQPPFPRRGGGGGGGNTRRGGGGGGRGPNVRFGSPNRRLHFGQREQMLSEEWEAANDDQNNASPRSEAMPTYAKQTKYLD